MHKSIELPLVTIGTRRGITEQNLHELNLLHLIKDFKLKRMLDGDVYIIPKKAYCDVVEMISMELGRMARRIND